MKKLFLFVYKRNRTVFIISGLALIITISYVASMNMEEWFTGIGKWFELLYNISLSIIAAFVFYIFQVILPTYKKDIISNVLMEKDLKECFEYIDTFFRDLVIKTDYYNGYTVNTTNFLEAHPEGYEEILGFTSSTNDNLLLTSIKNQYVESHNKDYIIEIDNYIDDITKKHYDLLDPIDLKEIFKIKNHTYTLSFLLKRMSIEMLEQRDNDLIIDSIKKLHMNVRCLQDSMDIKANFGPAYFEPISFDLI